VRAALTSRFESSGVAVHEDADPAAATESLRAELDTQQTKCRSEL